MDKNPIIDVAYFIDDKGNFCRDEIFLGEEFFGEGDFQAEGKLRPKQSYFDGSKRGMFGGIGLSRVVRNEGLLEWSSWYWGIECCEGGDRII